MILIDNHEQLVRAVAFLEEWQSTDAVIDAGDPEVVVRRRRAARVRTHVGDAVLTWEVELRLGKVAAPLSGVTLTDALAQAGATVKMNPLLEGLKDDQER